jgi:LPS sulfotransferase NodH
MAKPPANSGKPWTSADVAKLRELAKGNTPTRVIGIKLGRTPTAVTDKAGVERISLKPTNQRPYGSKS